jgi:L-ribulose-5-phosphate 3-epimerase
MEKHNRRIFLQTSVTALGAGLVSSTHLHAAPLTPSNHSTAIHAPAIAANKGKKPLRLGLIIAVGNDPDSALAKVRHHGLPTAQISVEEFHPGLDDRLRKALETHYIEATSVVVGGPGKEVWDFYGGPLTIGVVPRETRAARLAHIKKASDFARQCGIPAVQTHCGFIPENPNDDLYKETVETSAI